MTDTSNEFEGVEVPDTAPDGAAILDGISISEPGEDAGAEYVSPEGEELPEPGAVAMDKDAFWTVFETAFSLPGMVDHHFAPLAISGARAGQGRQASDALYNLLLVYYPKALMPMSDTFANLAALGLFGFGQAQIFKACLVERNRAKIEAQQEARAAAQAARSDQQRDQQPGPDMANSPLAWMDAEGSA